MPPLAESVIVCGSKQGAGGLVVVDRLLVQWPLRGEILQKGSGFWGGEGGWLGIPVFSFASFVGNLASVWVLLWLD